ncbi:MAG: MFS transporter [Bacillus sp. (in: Bacteria)]|nr:MFS transporter [Bacillus sp. (in: firmicutes)]
MVKTVEQPAASIWQNKIYMRLFASYSVSMLGHWFDMVAIMILFGYVWQAEPMLIALIPVALALPQALLGQFSGVIADKFDKVKLMMAADFLTAALTFILLLAQNPWIALVILSLRSVVNVIHFPAQQGLIKQVVDENLMLKAVTLNGIVNQLGKIMGPVIGGGIAGLFSPQLCIFINGVAFILSALILLSIILQNKLTATVNEQSEQAEAKSFWAAWRDGWRIVLKSRILLVSFSLSILGMIGVQMVDIQFPVLMRLLYPENPEIVGWLMGASGFGALLVFTIINRFEKLSGFGWILGGSAALIGIGFGAAGYLPVGSQLFMPILIGIIIGIAAGLFMIGSQYIMQTYTTKENIGRVSGIYNSLLSITVIISPPPRWITRANGWSSGSISVFRLGIVRDWKLGHCFSKMALERKSR